MATGHRVVRPVCHVRYDHAWAFRRDWVRDGIPWFVLPANQAVAATGRYQQIKLRYVRDRLSGTDKEEYLLDILKRVVPPRGSAQRQATAITGFVQDATWHNPLECPFEADERTIVSEAHELLELHDARCWHTAEIVRQLCLLAGLEARIRVLPHLLSPSVQVVTEVLCEAEWRVVDADYFKGHLIPRQPGGALPTLAWLRDHPHYFDRFRGGYIFPREYLTNAAGVPVEGQFELPSPDAEDTWGCDPYYCYYLGAERKFPPTAPAGVRAERVGRTGARITWHPSRSPTSQFILYEAEVRRVRDAALIVKRDDLECSHLDVGHLDSDEAYSVALRATDEHRLLESATWYPTTTKTFSLPAGSSYAEIEPPTV